MAAETKDVEAFQKGVEMIFTQFRWKSSRRTASSRLKLLFIVV